MKSLRGQLDSMLVSITHKEIDLANFTPWWREEQLETNPNDG
jgi:hypothetical protein